MSHRMSYSHRKAMSVKARKARKAMKATRARKSTRATKATLVFTWTSVWTVSVAIDGVVREYPVTYCNGRPMLQRTTGDDLVRDAFKQNPGDGWKRYYDAWHEENRRMAQGESAR